MSDQVEGVVEVARVRMQKIEARAALGFQLWPRRGERLEALQPAHYGK